MDAGKIAGVEVLESSTSNSCFIAYGFKKKTK
jgi:hypothetical protein